MNPLAPPINHIAAAIERAMPRILHMVGTAAVNYSKENFRRQGFNGQGWRARRKDKTPGRGILIGKGTGHLRNSIHITGTGTDAVTIGTDLPYAKIHNEGGTITYPSRNVILNFKTKGGKLKLAKVQTEAQQRKIKEIRRGTIGAHTTTMPQRQFIGSTPALTKELRELITAEIAQTFKIIT